MQKGCLTAVLGAAMDIASLLNDCLNKYCAATQNMVQM